MKPTASLREVEAERVVPWGSPAQYAWHVARYRFALSLARGNRVLDVGSGEGYGAALMAESAKHVVGVDYSPAAVEHARDRYEHPNLTFVEADVRSLPGPPESFDLVTCFEVLEHIDDHRALLDGIQRALVPGGTLLMSSPNAELERLHELVTGREHYAYHVNVLTAGGFEALLGHHFTDVMLYGQYARGNRLRFVLKLMDRYNLRHRLMRSRSLQIGVSQRVMGTPTEGSTSADDVEFSRLMVRQSPIVLARARLPKQF
ncbi:MAG: class I SAM-dependent methyltransferase [Solirubrobacteraceae bacterium]|nr:class I SAM-dependent methyltransferase [Solirubrobacteraceae bacterium]